MTLDIAFDPPEETPLSFYLEVVESGPPPGVTVNNGMYRMVRIDLFHHDAADAFRQGIPRPSSMDAGESLASQAIMRLFGLDHLASARDGLAVLGFIQPLGESSKTVPFEGWDTAWLARYRVEIVAPSVTASLADWPPRYLVPYPHWTGIDLSMAQRLYLADIAKQIFQPATLGLADPALIVTFLALLFDISSANSQTTTGLTGLNGLLGLAKEALEHPNQFGSVLEAITNGLLTTLDNPEPVIRRLSAHGPIIEATAKRLFDTLGDSAAVIQRLTTLGRWVSALGWIDVGLSTAALLDRPTYNFLVDTPAMRPVVSITPTPIDGVVSMPIAATPSMAWQSLTDSRQWAWVAGQSAMRADALERSGAVILRHPMMPANAFGMPWDGDWTPMRLEIRVEEVAADGTALERGARLLRTEAWDRFTDGLEHRALDLGGPWEWFVPEVPGQTWLQVTVTALDRGPYPDARRVGVARVPVTIEPARPTIATSPDGTVQIGDTRAPRIEITLPDGLLFATDRPFHGVVTPEAGGDRLRISQISVTGPARWSDEPELRRLPFDVILEQEANPGAHYPAIFYDPPGSEQLLSIDDDANYYDSMGPYVAFRNTGAARVLVSLAPNELSRGYDLAPVAAINYDIEPTTLRMELKSQDDPDADGSIVIENRARSRGELVGSFRLQVWANSDRLYDSDAMAYLEGTCYGGWLRITRITMEDDWARTRELPFMINLEMLDENGSSNDVARFTLREHGFAGEGAFAVRATLRDVLRAVHRGECRLRVSLEPRTGTDPARPVYEMPDPQSLRVLVPDPLGAELLSWTDEDGTMSLQSGSREVIRSTATVRGRITHHRVHSQTERLTLLIQNAGRPDRPFDLLAPSSGVTWNGEEFSVPVADLHRGTITARVSARNAIHDLEQLLDATDSASFQGVLPRAVRITQPSSEQIVIQNGLFIDAHRERAVAFELRDDRGGVLFRTDGTYHGNGVHQWVTLPAVTGNHAITAHAFNDFDEAVSEIVDLNAEAPRIDEIWVEPIGPGTHHPNDAHFYGHSTDRVRVNARLRFALRAVIRGTGLAGDWSLALNDAGPWEDTVSIELPIQALAEHRWQIEAANDFGRTDGWTPTVRRRGDVYSSVGLTVELWRRTNVTDDFLEVTVQRPGGQSDERAQPYVSIPIPEVTASSSEFLFLYGITWRGMTLNSDFVKVPKNMRSAFALSGSAFDPDWRVLHPYALVTPGSIDRTDDDGDGDSDEHPEIYLDTPRGRGWSRADLSSGSGGSYPVVWF